MVLPSICSPPQPWLSVALLARLGVGPTRAVVQPLMLFALLSPAKEVLQSLPVVLPPCLMRCWGAIFWRLGRCNEVNNLCKPEAVLLLFFLFFCSCSWLKMNLVALLVNLLDSWVWRKAFLTLLCSWVVWFGLKDIKSGFNWEKSTRIFKFWRRETESLHLNLSEY